MTSTPDPPYVERGGTQVYPPPYDVRGIRFSSFLLEADYGALEAYVDRVLNGPAKGAVVYKPLVGRVLLGYMDAAQVRVGPVDRPNFWIPERDLAFWVPVVSVRRLGPVEVATHLAWYLSYVMVDDAWAVASGREVFGFPKELATFTQEPPDGGVPEASFLSRLSVATLTVEAFGPAARAESRPLVEIRRVDDAPAGVASRTFATIEEAARDFLGILAGGARVTLPGLGIVHELFDLIDHHEYPLIFLKQFRDHVDARLACYQAIVEAPVRITRFRKAGWLPGRYAIRIGSFASHPIVADLGLKGAEPPVLAAAYLDFDFLIDEAKQIAGG